MKTITDMILLNNDVKIPILGLGTWQTPDNQVGYQAVFEALKLGYRHIDTAAAYGNEAIVGKAIKDSGLNREEIFVTTKLWNNIRGYDATKKAIQTSLDELGLDYIDLYLIHWPNPLPFRNQWETMNAESYKAMEEAYDEGKIRAIGVSNFMERHLDALLKTARITPAVNQIRLCPGDRKEALVDYCRQLGIVLEAYSPLGTGKVFDVDALKTLAEKYNTTVAKLSLRWSLQMGFIPLPKTINVDRLKSNAELFDFVIDEDDMTLINNLDGCCGISPNPDERPF